MGLVDVGAASSALVTGAKKAGLSAAANGVGAAFFNNPNLASSMMQFFNTAYLSDNDRAQSIFGYKGGDWIHTSPRHVFEYFVVINFNESPGTTKSALIGSYINYAERQSLTTLVKSITMPSYEIDTEIKNSYNRRRIIHKKLNHGPVELVMHDVPNGLSLRLWELYYEYYYKDGNYVEKTKFKSITPVETEIYNPYNVSIRSRTGYGFRTGQESGIYRNEGTTIHPTDNLIDSIDIYQMRGGRFSKTSITNPKITGFNQSALSYDSDSLAEVKFTISYENVLYTNFNFKFDEDMENDMLQNYKYNEVDVIGTYIGKGIDYLLGSGYTGERERITQPTVAPAQDNSFSGNFMNTLSSGLVGAVGDAAGSLLGPAGGSAISGLGAGGVGGLGESLSNVPGNLGRAFDSTVKTISNAQF